MRLCLSLRVIPVFTPPREPGFQASIEALNGRWQAKVWSRFEHSSLAGLAARSEAYVAAARARAAQRIDAAPPRRPFPVGWSLDLAAPPQGRIVYMRRTNEQGAASLLGRTFPVDPLWSHRLVRAEVDLQVHCIRFYALRRREPTVQPLLCECPYRLPQRKFKERPGIAVTCHGSAFSVTDNCCHLADDFSDLTLLETKGALELA